MSRITLYRYSEPGFSVDAIRQLFQEYNDFLEIDLDFQNFETELADLPGKYAPEKRGQLYLLMDDLVPVGCAALYAFNETTCEVKRVYVAPRCHGQGLGRLLMETAIADARELGYHTMVLDSLGRLKSAQALYQKLGFHTVEPYNQNPHPDAYYMALPLMR